MVNLKGIKAPISIILLLILLITETFFFIYKTSELEVGVSEGDYTKYKTLLKQKYIDKEDKKSELLTIIQILLRDQNTITFKEITQIKGINDSQIITGDPTEPHFEHPFFRINDLFIPKGLWKNDIIPQTVVLTDENDETRMLPWCLKINETLRISTCGYLREANQITLMVRI